MDKYAGLWINHKEAVIVILTGKEVNTKVVESKTEGHFRLTGGSRSKTPYGPQEATSEHGREERYKHHLQKFYERVIKVISDAKGVLIFGPGEAKTELKKEIEKHKELASKVASIDPADQMTKNEITLKVKKFFKSKTEQYEYL